MSTSRSRRPYLIRAIHAWALDCGYTPHLLVAADYPGVSVPRGFVKDNRIVLDVSPMAVRDLNLEHDPIFFSARFGGRSYEVVVPSGAVLAIFARENGEGILFGEPEPIDAEARRRGRRVRTSRLRMRPRPGPAGVPSCAW